MIVLRMIVWRITNKSSPEGLVIEYKDESSLNVLQKSTKEFDGPILVDVSDIFPLPFNSILGKSGWNYSGYRKGYEK